MQEIVSYSYARNHLKEALDKVCDHRQILIKRKNGANVIMISEDDFNSLDETLHLLSSEKNRKYLRESIKETSAKKGKKFKSVKAFESYIDSL